MTGIKLTRRMIGGARVRQMVAVLLSLALVLAASAASAEGSRTLYPAAYPNNAAGGYRADLDLSSASNHYAGVAARRQFLYVYAKAGEYIELGSSNRNNGGDINVYNPQSFGTKADETVPASADFTCSAGPASAATGSFFGATLGYIAARANELAGPNSADASASVANGYDPCAYKAPVTGIYGVVFTGATSGGSNPDAKIDTLHVGNKTVAAWDVTVRDGVTSTTDENGRLFTYAWVGFTAGNDRPVFHTFYYVTPDGSRYKQTMQGLDPNGYALWGSTFGFLDNGQPLYKDIRGDSALVDNGIGFGTGKELSAQIPTAAMFFSSIDSGAADAAQVDTVLQALGIPLTPPPPEVADPQFNGLQSGDTTYVGGGGTFTFTALNDTSYQIVISAGTDFDPANASNATLTGFAPDGPNTVTWNGLANNGSAFPIGNFTFKIVGRNGEIHFPIIDAEGNGSGGPTLTRLNGSNAPDSTVFYDDRGYVTRDGTAVGTLNSYLCGAGTPTPPTPDHSLIGVDSSVATGGLYYRSWPGDGNKNVDCNTSAGFGDAKALDLWSYQRTAEQTNPVKIVSQPSDATVSTAVSVPPTAYPGDTVYGSFNFQNVGTTDATGVAYTATIGTPGSCPTNVAFSSLPPGPPAVTFTYNATTCAVTFANMPTTLAGGDALDFNFSYTAPASGSVPVDTTINATVGGSDSANGVTNIIVADVDTSVSVPATAPGGSMVSGSIAFGNTSAATATANGVTYSATVGSATGGACTPAAITNVAFTCTPSASATCTAFSGATATQDPNTCQVTFTNMPSSLLAGDQISVDFDYIGPASGTVPVASAITTSTPETTTSNNTASGQTVFSANPPNITLEKSGPATAAQGVAFDYTVKLGNSGSGASGTTVTVEDVLPAGVTANSVTVGTGVTSVNCGTLPSAAAATLTCTVTLSSPLAASAANGAASFTINATAANTGSIINYASVDPTGGSTPPTPGTGCTPATSCGNATTTIGTPVLRILKTASVSSYVVGTPYTYTIKVTNTGSAATTAAASVSDTIPTGLTIGTLTGGCSAASQVVTCPIASGFATGAGNAKMFTIQVTPTATATTGDNTAAVTGGGDPNCTTNTDCTSTVTLGGTPKLTITKTASPTTFVVGQPASYTITVKNTGSADTTAVATVNDTIPAGLTIGTPLPTGCNAVNQAVTCTITAGLTAGTGSTSFTIPVTPTATATSGNNTAYVTGGGDPDCTGTKCPGMVDVPINTAANITLQKAGPAKATEGTAFDYTVGLGNSGQTDSGTTVTVADVMPANVVANSVSVGPGVSAVNCGTLPSAAGATLTCTLTLNPVLAAGSSNGAASFTINATANKFGDIINYASVDPTGGDTPPPPGETCIPATSCGSAPTTIGQDLPPSVKVPVNARWMLLSLLALLGLFGGLALRRKSA